MERDKCVCMSVCVCPCLYTCVCVCTRTWGDFVMVGQTGPGRESEGLREGRGRVRTTVGVKVVVRKKSLNVEEGQFYVVKDIRGVRVACLLLSVCLLTEEGQINHSVFLC